MVDNKHIITMYPTIHITIPNKLKQSIKIKLSNTQTTLSQQCNGHKRTALLPLLGPTMADKASLVTDCLISHETTFITWSC